VGGIVKQKPYHNGPRPSTVAQLTEKRARLLVAHRPKNRTCITRYFQGRTRRGQKGKWGEPSGPRKGDLDLKGGGTLDRSRNAIDLRESKPSSRQQQITIMRKPFLLQQGGKFSEIVRI